MLNQKVFSMGIAGILAAHPNLKMPGDLGLTALKEMLDYIPDEVFKKACETVARSQETPWALLACIERAACRVMGYLDSDEAFDLLGEMIDSFYMPGLGETCYQLICNRLRERGQDRLIPFFKSFGVDIWNRENPTALRAQFKRSYESRMQGEIKNFLLEEPKRRREIANKPKQIPANVETIKPEDWQTLKDLLNDSIETN